MYCVDNETHRRIMKEYWDFYKLNIMGNQE